MRLRHQSVSAHVRTESQRSVNYDANQTRYSDQRGSISQRLWRSWKLLAALFLVIAAFNLFLAKSVRQLYASSTFHLLVPVTNANQYLCQLLLSLIILNYPTPVFLTWDSPNKAISSQEQLGRVDVIKTYLESIPTSDDDDLVMIVDGHDVWFQLPPEVVLLRYFATLKILNGRSKNRGRTSILFGADKTCAPSMDKTLVGCWAPPESTLPMFTYGPYNDTSFDDAVRVPAHTRPRWLNAGSIIGPAGDLRQLFREVSRHMHDDETPKEAVWYFSHLYGVQEYSKASQGKGGNGGLPASEIKDWNIQAGKSTDFHVGLDYANSLFQPIGNNDQYITWWNFDRSNAPGLSATAKKRLRHSFQLGKEFLKARRPFDAMQGLKLSAYNEKYQDVMKKTGRPSFKSWSQVPLALNTATHQVFAMLHFTFEKDYRDIWWEKLWFYPYARDLLRSSAALNDKPLSPKKINGRTWYNSQVPVTNYVVGSNQERRDGAWTEKGEWKSFNTLCSVHEEDLFGTSFDSTVLNY